MIVQSMVTETLKNLLELMLHTAQKTLKITGRVAISNPTGLGNDIHSTGFVVSLMTLVRTGLPPLCRHRGVDQ